MTTEKEKLNVALRVVAARNRHDTPLETDVMLLRDWVNGAAQNTAEVDSLALLVILEELEEIKKSQPRRRL